MVKRYKHTNQMGCSTVMHIDGERYPLEHGESVILDKPHILPGYRILVEEVDIEDDTKKKKSNKKHDSKSIGE